MSSRGQKLAGHWQMMVDLLVVLVMAHSARIDSTEQIAMKHFQDWKLWEFTLYLLLNNTGVYAFSDFLPVMLKNGCGCSTARAQLRVKNQMSAASRSPFRTSSLALVATTSQLI
ncbi:hypothetical protein AYL99_11601 [Fonsecaea erecta]|uniref:Uncharacterized protein n=1 Tax=Fonsecaea erecta TaxID=1367422 RepID=A0A178Z2W5_9EURO|nr:hypothetical protein AYL99_11601 [Fonsecaea erecta]OAP54067.1 hypothetical protein AYL99_11601 [Fonsecaea erecta]